MDVPAVGTARTAKKCCLPQRGCFREEMPDHSSEGKSEAISV